MSQSPLEPAPAAGLDPYRRAWSAINKLMRRGYSWSGREQNCAFLNLTGSRSAPGTHRFADVSAASGFDLPDDARALALLDWDGDGDQDVLLSNRTGPRLRFLRNDQPTGNAWVTLELRGTRANRDAVGARVELTLRGPSAPERRLLRAVRAGEGYLSQSSTRLTVGLGAAPVEIAATVVTWPGGRRETFAGLSPGAHWLLVEGRGEAQVVQRKRATKPLVPSTPTPPAASLAARVVLTRPVPLPTLGLATPDGASIDLFGLEAGGTGSGTGRTIWLSLFSTTCAPCARELGQLAARARDLQQGGVACLAACVDAPQAPVGQEPPAAPDDGAGAFLERVGWPFPWARIRPEALETLDGLVGVLLDRERRLPLPASFLIDATGALRVIYLGPVSAETLLADRELCDLGESALLEASTPFAGRWMFPLRESDADFFEGRLRARGLERAAAEYARGRLDVVRSSRADLLFDFGLRAAAAGRFDEALDFYRRCLELQPDHYRALFDAAVVNHRLERLAEAIELYRLAVAARPDEVDARFNLALALLGTGQVDEARRLQRWLEEKDARAAEILSGAILQWEEPGASPR